MSVRTTLANALVVKLKEAIEIVVQLGKLDEDVRVPEFVSDLEDMMEQVEDAIHYWQTGKLPE